MRITKMAPFAVAAVLAGGAVTGVAAADPVDEESKLTTPISGSESILHLFGWNWKSVASECTNVLGPAKFPSIEVSAPQEHVVLPDQNYPWWQDYQPVSYQLESRRGSAEESPPAMWFTTAST